MSDSISDAYKAGFIDGVSAYAHWIDGVQYVGTTGKELADAVQHVKHTWNYSPPKVVLEKTVSALKLADMALTEWDNNALGEQAQAAITEALRELGEEV